MSDQSEQNVTKCGFNREMSCDAALTVQHQRFPVHKVILSKASMFFGAMFERWGRPDERDFTVGGVSAQTMVLVLQWIYTDSAELNPETVQDLLIAADMLLLHQLVRLCFEFLEENMTPQNCVGIWKLSGVVLSRKTQGLAWRFILRNFEEVMACAEYQDLTAEDLTGILESNGLHVTNETVVFEALLRWTNHNLQERRAHFPQLLNMVRFTEISYDSINSHVLSCPLVDNCASCLATVSLACTKPPAARSRLPEAVLLVIGGWSGRSPINSIEAYDYKADRWFHVANQEKPRAYHGSVFLDGSVYCLGGFDGSEHFNTVRRLDLESRVWDEMLPMYHRRCYVSAAVMDGRIYALGGFDGRARLSTAQVFDPKTCRWSLIAPMNEPRSDAKCAALNGKIYICEGFNSSDCLQTAECYCPQTNQWSFIAPMTTRRCGAAVAAYGNRLYAFGGFDGFLRLHTVEVYSPHTDSWREVAPMHTTRSNVGIGVLNNRIFAVGGYDGVSTTFRVEAYHPLEDRWSEVRDMDIFRSAVNCCVISDLPNMADYTFPRDDFPLRSETDEEDEGFEDFEEVD